MLRLVKYAIILTLFGACVVAYSQVMLRQGSGHPPQMAREEEQAHEIFVIKSSRELHLLRNDKIIKSYPISLGGVPSGHKQQEGDQRTPEGKYVIDWRNENSIAHLSLHISYPNETDKKVASNLGVSPGGNIMIHGILNGWGMLGSIHLLSDWTNGCIAVTNKQMREIWSLVPNGTPITIVDKI